MESGPEFVGKRAEIPGIIDDSRPFFFDPAYVIDENGKIRITEISLCKKDSRNFNLKRKVSCRDKKEVEDVSGD